MIAAFQDLDSTVERIRTVADLSEPELRLVETLAVILGIVVLRWIILFLVRRRTQDARVRYTWGKGVTYVLATIALFIVARIWFSWLGSLATFLGLLSAGLAVALREPVQDLAGWIFLIWRRPFGVGDRIEVEGRAGDVIDQRLFQFTILEIGNWVDADQSTGRLIHVPNGKVFTQPISNYTRSFPYIWNELPITITFESDWREAKQILHDIASKHAEHLTRDAEERILTESRRFMIFYSTLTPTVYTRIEENGVRLTIRYLCEARRRRGTASAIYEEVLHAFGEREDIMFAYPTQRFYDNRREGKPGVRPDPFAEEREP